MYKKYSVTVILAILAISSLLLAALLHPNPLSGY